VTFAEFGERHRHDLANSLSAIASVSRIGFLIRGSNVTEDVRAGPGFLLDQSHLLPARKLIASCCDEVTKRLDWMTEAPASSAIPLAELADHIALVKKMKQNMGRTALLLSGGGAQSGVHLQTVRALIDGGVCVMTSR
jgi:hypothetical protein